MTRLDAAAAGQLHANLVNTMHDVLARAEAANVQYVCQDTQTHHVLLVVQCPSKADADDLVALGRRLMARPQESA